MSADFWAGYVSGAAGILIGNPLDLLKVRLQAGTGTAAAAATATATFNAPAPAPAAFLAASAPRETWASTFDRAGMLVRGNYRVRFHACV